MRAPRQCRRRPGRGGRAARCAARCPPPRWHAALHAALPTPPRGIDAGSPPRAVGNVRLVPPRPARKMQGRGRATGASTPARPSGGGGGHGGEMPLPLPPLCRTRGADLSTSVVVPRRAVVCTRSSVRAYTTTKRAAMTSPIDMTNFTDEQLGDISSVRRSPTVPALHPQKGSLL